jgi:glutamyl-tRNA reductase
MNQTAPGVIALVTHARDVPAAAREAFASRVRNELGGHAVIVETCHRVEAYWIAPADAERMPEAGWLPPGGRALGGTAAARHAVAVAVGRDSVVVGEDQVLHQVRESVEAARRAGHLDSNVERLFALALHAGRKARSWQQGPSTSLADVALAEIARRIGPLAGREILVVGAGRMGRLAAAAARAAGASVSITSRSADHAEALATATGSQPAPFDPGASAGRFAGVVVALAGRWELGGETIGALVAGPAVVVDLSVPPALADEAIEALGARLVSADALALVEPDGSRPTAARVIRLDALVDETVRQYAEWVDGRDSRATADALIRRADREREAELELLWRRLPNLEPEVRAAIDGMARHLARRLMREPLERLGRDSDGTDEQVVRDLFAL